MLLAVISLGKTFQVRARSIKFDINSGADKKYGPKEPSLGHVNSEKTNLIVNHQDQMQIREIQSRDFLDETNDALEDATSTLKNVQSYMKQAGILLPYTLKLFMKCNIIFSPNFIIITCKKCHRNFISSTGNRKTWARIPAQSKASFFPQKDFQNSLILGNIFKGVVLADFMPILKCFINY